MNKTDMAKRTKKDMEEKVEEAVDTGKVMTEEELFGEDAQKQDDKAKEYLDMAQRIQAEFDNYRRRNLDIAKNSRQDGIIHSVTELLPVVDTIKSAQRQVQDETFAKSIDLIYKQIIECFAKLGVTKIEAVGKPFDPNYHNAIMAEEANGVEPDMVIEEFQEGFMIDGRVIRHSVVKVSK